MTTPVHAESHDNAPLLRDERGPVHVLIMGASGGIGLAMVCLLLDHPQTTKLFAVARNARLSASLVALQSQHPNRLYLLDADITSEPQLASVAECVANHTPALQLVINCAGMLHTASRGPEKTLSQLTMNGLQESFSVNAFGPILLAKALMPLFRHGGPMVFASLSARVGSIADNRLGGWYSYRAAKTAQNQLLKTLSVELARLNRHSIVLALHPGTTDTALSKPFQANVSPDKLFAPSFSAQCLLAIIARRSPAETGGFYAWDGQAIDW